MLLSARLTLTAISSIINIQQPSLIIYEAERGIYHKYKAFKPSRLQRGETISETKAGSRPV